MASLSLHQCHLLCPLTLLFLHPDRICYRAPLAELVKHGAPSAASRSRDAAKKKEVAALTFPRHEVRSSSPAQEPVLIQAPTLHCFRVVGVGQDVQALFDHHPLCGLLGLHGQLPVEHHCPVHPSHMSHWVQGTDYLITLIEALNHSSGVHLQPADAHLLPLASAFHDHILQTFCWVGSQVFGQA